jgi:hypothetical protein
MAPPLRALQPPVQRTGAGQARDRRIAAAAFRNATKLEARAMNSQPPPCSHRVPQRDEARAAGCELAAR